VGDERDALKATAERAEGSATARDALVGRLHMSTHDSFSWGAETLTHGRRIGHGHGGGRRPGARGSTRRLSLIGVRGEALLRDGLLLLVPLLLTAFLLSLAFPHQGFWFSSVGTTTSTNGSNASTTSSISLGLGPSGWLVVTALTFSYFFLFEALRGQTIGKRSVGLHVESVSGGPASLNQVSARTVLRLIDALPLFYLVGVTVAVLTGSRRRRLGDWVGGTVVVRDGVPPEVPARPLWRVLAYPLSWTVAAFVVVFALGIGTATGADEQAVSLVRSYEQARQHGDGALACSMVSREQQREMVAIETGNYRDPQPALCPVLILRSDPASHLLNSALAAFVEGPMSARYSSAGVALVSSQTSPGLGMIVLFEHGHPVLDQRGAEKLEFAQGCRLSGGTSIYCECMWTTLRAEGLLDRLARRVGVPGLAADERRCHAA
jgi:uncharacterized RDD family membrane protein YckC